MTHVLNVHVDTSTGTLRCEVAEHMPPELGAQMFAAAAMAYAKTNTPGASPRDILERAIRQLVDNPDALVDRSLIVAPGAKH